MSKILTLFILLLSYSLKSQTAFPLSFYWTGKIPAISDFEMRVNMYESDKLLSGKGSKLKGECLFLQNHQIYRIEGEVLNNELNFNCFDENGKMIYSFQFPGAEGRQTLQKGKWTDGKTVLECSLETSASMNLPKSHMTAFCVAANLRRNSLITEDSTFSEKFKYLPQTLFKPIGEGYRLTDIGYAYSNYYGTDYLEYIDSLKNTDGDFLISKLAWQLIDTKETMPEILEIREQWKNDRLLSLKVEIFNFRDARWQKKELELLPEFTPAKIFYGRKSIYYFKEDGSVQQLNLHN